jgi:hypothetical protein
MPAFDPQPTLAPSAKNGRDWPKAEWQVRAIESKLRTLDDRRSDGMLRPVANFGVGAEIKNSARIETSEKPRSDR